MIAWMWVLGCGRGECPDDAVRDDAGDCAGANESDADTDADADSDTDTDADADSDTDTDSDADTDTPDPLGDRDADGVANGDEPTWGTDPDDADSDDDTYLDGWEILEGTDPTDRESRIYVGYWPYNPDKDSYAPPIWDDAHLAAGEALPRFAYVDQFGDAVDIYDFAGHGRDVVVVVSAVWAGESRFLSQWLAGDYPEYDERWPTVRDAVDTGAAYWVTVLEDDFTVGESPDPEDAVVWAEMFPSDVCPVLVGDGEMERAYVSAGWPVLVLVDENLEIVSYTSGATIESWFAPIYDLAERL
jgi:hypothetical protein